MFGNNIDSALDISLLENTISDMRNTPAIVEQKREINPLLRGFDPNQKGAFQLYGLLANALFQEMIKDKTDNQKKVSKILANLLEAGAAHSVNADWKIPIYSEKW